MVQQYDKADNTNKKDMLFNLYISNINRINNWNLVDNSAHLIVGRYLFNSDRKLLFDLAKSNNMWERRISIVSTWYFIRQGEYKDTFTIADMLINDKEDLIHKATGWMLREIGKKIINELILYLDKNYRIMPRTMLRYSIEKLDSKQKSHYLSKY